MKKTITALAAIALAGSLYAAVESVNIVGYTTHDIPVGYSVLTAPFIPVASDGETFTLDMLQPNANWDGENNDMIQFFGSNGRTSMTVTYWDGWGWYDVVDGDLERNNLELDTTTAGFIYATQPGAQFTVAGQVEIDGIEVDVPQGYAMIGNPLPRTILLGEIVPNANWDGDNNDMIQFFGSNGRTSMTVTYWDGWGWYDVVDGDLERNDYEVEAGAGFFVMATKQGAAFSFPEAIPAN